jgi:hypothetical protein
MRQSAELPPQGAEAVTQVSVLLAQFASKLHELGEGEQHGLSDLIQQTIGGFHESSVLQQGIMETRQEVCESLPPFSAPAAVGQGQRPTQLPHDGGQRRLIVA